VGVALHGNLRDFGIGEVFQLIGQQQKTGVLDVTADSARVRIAFDRGSVVWGETVGPYEHAALGDLVVRSGLVAPERLLALERAVQDGEGDLRTLLTTRGELGEAQVQEAVDLLTHNTMFLLLRWTQGSFHFTAQPVMGEGDTAKTTPAEQILMDALRMVDEWRTFDADARALDTVWKRSDAFDVFRERAEGESAKRIALAQQLFDGIDGRASGARLLELARIAEFDGVYWLSRLRRAGVIEPLARARAPARVRAGLSFHLFGSLASVSALIPVALLVLALAALATSRAERAAGAALAQQGEAAFARARARGAVEAYRFAHGAWPNDIATALAEVPGAMATENRGAYYFAHRGDNFVVLMPEE
jgi:hypothetical protein